MTVREASIKTDTRAKVSDFLFTHKMTVTLLLLAPPLIWMCVIYLGSLVGLLIQSFYSLDEFSGSITRQFTLSTYGQLLTAANLEVMARTVTIATVVTAICAVIAFPISYYAARYANGGVKALFYVAVMLPLWSSYLIKIYAFKLILAKEGIVSWLAQQLHLKWALDGVLALPTIGGPSLSLSYIGTVVVFVYVWLPYMILPIQSSLERVPANYLEAAADLGANSGQIFRKIVLPLSLPGIVAGSIFTFSFTLGDYIIPQIIGNSRLMIGQAIFTLQGSAGNIPLAAAFAVIPIVIMALYLYLAKRLGAFDVI